MKITLTQLQEFANNFLDTLKNNGITSLEHLSESKIIPVNGNSNEFLKIEPRLSDYTGYVLTHHLKNTSVIPIQGVINPYGPFGHIKINCETMFMIPNYEYATSDFMNNKTQIKMSWSRADFNFLIEELNRIKDYQLK